MPSSTGDWNGTTETEPLLKFNLRDFTNDQYTGFEHLSLFAHITFPGSVVPTNNYDSGNFGWINGVSSNIFFSVKKGYIFGNHTWFTTAGSPAVTGPYAAVSTFYSNDMGMIDSPQGPFAGISSTLTSTYSSGFPNLDTYNFFASSAMYVNGTSSANNVPIAWFNPSANHQFKISAQRTGGTPGLLVCFPQIQAQLSPSW
jgi:hypothetical protein